MGQLLNTIEKLRETLPGDGTFARLLDCLSKQIERLILNDIDPVPDLAALYNKIRRCAEATSIYLTQPQARAGLTAQLDELFSDDSSPSVSENQQFFTDKDDNHYYEDLNDDEDDSVAKATAQADTIEPADDDEDIFLDFLQEAAEYVQTLENEVIDLEEQPRNKEIINNVFRPFHTLKGVSGFMGLKKLNLISHETENLLDMARNDKLLIDEKVIQGILLSLDTIKHILTGLSPSSRDENIKPDQLERLLEHLRVLATEKKHEGVDVSRETLFEVAETAPEEEKKKTRDNRVKVRTEKLDYLVDMVGELVINSNLVRMDRNVQGIQDQEFVKKLSQLTRVVGELQNASMSLRMVPIAATFTKMKRVVRDYTHKTGKDITLVLRGEETEIDRNFVDSLYDPLVHMIRNSCDHGIEPEEERKAAGKPLKGEITLHAYHKGNHIVIDVIDDGKGLNKDAILKKAIERGLARENETYTDKDIFQFIFGAGFSTAKVITKVSGRGVGMDVVRQSVKALGGSIDIDSTPGVGSRFGINLPLTLAIIEGMMVKVGSELFIIPVINVKRTLQPKSDQINTIVGRGETLNHQDRLIPISRVYKIFEIEDAIERYEDSLLIIVSGDNKEYAIQVDNLVGIQDIVIKSLGDKFADLKGISGATILGDGSVGLILDINNLVDLGR